jgi:hypothetical protein
MLLDEKAKIVVGLQKVFLQLLRLKGHSTSLVSGVDLASCLDSEGTAVRGGTVP